MAPKAPILLEGSKMGTGQLYVQAAKRLGLQRIVLSADPAQYDYLATENIEAIRVDTNDLDALIREVSRRPMRLPISRALQTPARRSMRLSPSSAGISVYRAQTRID